ncbi:MAG: 3-hydroxyacyl-CoA dehydrogenase family protein [Planctomycetota bacterium]
MSPNPPTFRNVTVIGAGTMGAGIAQVCAAAGSAVALADVNREVLDRAIAGISAFLDKGIAKGKATPDDKDRVLTGIQLTEDVAGAMAEADLVIEAVPEKLELKRDLFAKAAASAPAACVLATNTSSLSLAEIFAGIPGPERCLGTHFFNPPPIMALLEVVRPASAAEATVQRVLDYARELGKDPIVVRDSPGFATSRLGVALGLEAIRMIEEDVASPEDIDKALVLGYRHPMGPLRLTDLVGLDVRMAIADYLREKLNSPAFEVPQLMRDMVARGELGKKSGRGFYDWSTDGR